MSEPTSFRMPSPALLVFFLSFITLFPLLSSAAPVQTSASYPNPDSHLHAAFHSTRVPSLKERAKYKGAFYQNRHATDVVQLHYPLINGATPKCAHLEEWVCEYAAGAKEVEVEELVKKELEAIAATHSPTHELCFSRQRTSVIFDDLPKTHMAAILPHAGGLHDEAHKKDKLEYEEWLLVAGPSQNIYIAVAGRGRVVGREVSNPSGNGCKPTCNAIVPKHGSCKNPQDWAEEPTEGIAGRFVLTITVHRCSARIDSKFTLIDTSEAQAGTDKDREVMRNKDSSERLHDADESANSNDEDAAEARDKDANSDAAWSADDETEKSRGNKLRLDADDQVNLAFAGTEPSLPKTLPKDFLGESPARTGSEIEQRKELKRELTTRKDSTSKFRGITPRIKGEHWAMLIYRDELSTTGIRLLFPQLKDPKFNYKGDWAGGGSQSPQIEAWIRRVIADEGPKTPLLSGLNAKITITPHKCSLEEWKPRTVRSVSAMSIHASVGSPALTVEEWWELSSTLSLKAQWPDEAVRQDPELPELLGFDSTKYEGHRLGAKIRKVKNAFAIGFSNSFQYSGPWPFASPASQIDGALVGEPSNAHANHATNAEVSDQEERKRPEAPYVKPQMDVENWAAVYHDARDTTGIRILFPRLRKGQVDLGKDWVNSDLGREEKKWIKKALVENETSRRIASGNLGHKLTYITHEVRIRLMWRNDKGGLTTVTANTAAISIHARKGPRRLGSDGWGLLGNILNAAYKDRWGAAHVPRLLSVDNAFDVGSFKDNEYIGPWSIWTEEDGDTPPGGNDEDVEIDDDTSASEQDDNDEDVKSDDGTSAPEQAENDTLEVDEVIRHGDSHEDKHESQPVSERPEDGGSKKEQEDGRDDEVYVPKAFADSNGGEDPTSEDDADYEIDPSYWLAHEDTEGEKQDEKIPSPKSDSKPSDDNTGLDRPTMTSDKVDSKGLLDDSLYVDVYWPPEEHYGDIDIDDNFFDIDTDMVDSTTDDTVHSPSDGHEVDHPAPNSDSTNNAKRPRPNEEYDGDDTAYTDSKKPRIDQDQGENRMAAHGGATDSLPEFINPKMLDIKYNEGLDVDAAGGGGAPVTLPPASTTGDSGQEQSSRNDQTDAQIPDQGPDGCVPYAEECSIWDCCVS